MLHPILDEFYSEDLNHDRSSCYAVSKGLVSTAPGTTVPPQNAKEACGSSAECAAHDNMPVSPVVRTGHSVECTVAP